MSAGPLGCLGGREGSGQSVLVDGLSRALAAFGNQVRVYVRRDDPTQPATINAAPNLTIVYVDAGPPEPGETLACEAAVGAFAAELERAWRLNPPGAIHAFSWDSGRAAVTAARGCGVPVVQTFVSLPSGGRRRDAALDAQSALVRSAARIIATSSAQVFALLRLGADPTAIKFVPSGVDLSQFTPAPPAPPKPPGALRIATLGELGEREGVDDVVEALAFLDGVRLTVGGGIAGADDILRDPDAQRLHALANARGVGALVTFRGNVKRHEVPDYLRAADVVVCAPREDSLGTVALEAMACGVPVIVSAVGGLADAVVDGMTGMHVPPHAPRQLAYAIDALRADPQKCERFRRYGVERTVARYAWPRIAAEAFEVYASVATRRARLSQSSA